MTPELIAAAYAAHAAADELAALASELAQEIEEPIDWETDRERLRVLGRRYDRGSMALAAIVGHFRNPPVLLKVAPTDPTPTE